MSPPWSALLLLIILDEAGSVRPVVTFHPNWDIIFTTELLTMTCDVRSPIPGDTSYVWYKDTRRTHTGPTLIIRNAKEGDSGDYQCESATSGRSDPTTLNVKPDTENEWVILQVPLHVHEGDDVTLRCHHYPGYTGRDTIFYKDDVIIRNWGSDPELQIKDIKGGRFHRYKCTKRFRGFSFYLSPIVQSSITVTELFSTPEIRVTPSPIIEGDHVTVTCHTNVSPYRPETPLTFTFLKDGQNVQSFGISDQYGVRSAHPGDSGKYSCEVTTVSGGSIVKRSDEINIEINAFMQPEIIMTPNLTAEGDAMTLTCHTKGSPLIPDTGLHFAFYKDGHNVQEFSLSDQYGVQSTQAKHSGNYSCKVRVLSNNLTKSSEELYIQIQGGDKSDSIFIQNIFRMILSGVILLLCLIFVVYHIRFINSLELVNRKLQRSPEL